LWDNLADDDLDHLLRHLLAANRLDDFKALLLDTTFLRAVLNRRGVLQLTDQLSRAAADHRIDLEGRDLLKQVRELIVRNAAILASPDYRESEGPFANQLVAAARRHAKHLVASRLWLDRATSMQEGWLHLAAFNSAVGAPQMTRFRVPGDRAAYFWGPDTQGPDGLEIWLAADVRRQRLLVESAEVNRSAYGSNPTRFYWRIWDISSGSILFDKQDSAGPKASGWKQIGDWTGGRRPRAFSDDGLMRAPQDSSAFGSAWKLLEKQPKAVRSRLSKLRYIFLCASGPERLYWGEGPDRRMRLILWRGQRRQQLVDFEVPEGFEPQLLLRIDNQLMVFALYNSDAWRIDLDVEGNPDKDTKPVQLPNDRLQHLTESPVLLSNLKLHEYSGPFYLLTDGQLLLQLRNWGRIRIWRATDGKPVGTIAGTWDFSGPYGRTSCFAITPDEQHVAAVVDGNTIRVWNIAELHGGIGEIPDITPSLPHWKLNDIKISDEIKGLTFFWGGRLLAATTDGDELLVLRFWSSSSILARVGLSENVIELRGVQYGNSVFCVGKSGAIYQYEFCYLPRNDVTSLDGSYLTIRLRYEDASDISVAGSFCEWSPSPLRRETSDLWHSAPFFLPPGTHEYKLLVNGHRWLLDPHIPFHRSGDFENNYITLRPNECSAFARATSAIRL
jgi:hypothetical protein